MDIMEKKLYAACGNLEVLNPKGISYDCTSRTEDIPEIEELIYQIDWNGENTKVRSRLGELGVTRVINHDERKALMI